MLLHCQVKSVIVGWKKSGETLAKKVCRTTGLHSASPNRNQVKNGEGFISGEKRKMTTDINPNPARGGGGGELGLLEHQTSTSTVSGMSHFKLRRHF